jgi:phosphomannomutase
VLGGEGNGGVIDPRIHLGRDAAVAAAWLLEAHASRPDGLRGLALGMPPRYILKAKVDLPEGGASMDYGEILASSLGPIEDGRDGFRWSFADGFLHVRPSATEPIVRVIAEAASEPEARTLIDRVVGASSPGGRG